jgi:hypothetical protein
MNWDATGNLTVNPKKLDVLNVLSKVVRTSELHNLNLLHVLDGHALLLLMFL